MAKYSSILSRHPVLDKLCELLIALVIVSGLVCAAFFFGAHEDASWMPSPKMWQNIGWSLAGFGFGAAYLYLALSTRRLEQRVSNMPQLRQLLTSGQRWFVSLAISGLFFILGCWSLWQVMRQYGTVLPPTQRTTISTTSFQILAGMVCMVWGASMLKLRTHLASKSRRGRLAYSAVSLGMVIYGALSFGSGVWRLLK